MTSILAFLPLFFLLSFSFLSPLLIAILRVENDDLEGDLIFASEGTALAVDCFGSGGLSWQTTANVSISTSSSDPVYTISDPSRTVLTLHIPNFMGALTATYTCVSDLVPGLEHSIFITNGEGEREVGRKGVREGGREEGSEGGREGGRREGGREGGREGAHG